MKAQYLKFLRELKLEKFLTIFYLTIVMGLFPFSYGVFVKHLPTIYIGLVMIVAGLTFAINYIKVHRCEG